MDDLIRAGRSTRSLASTGAAGGFDAAVRAASGRAPTVDPEANARASQEQIAAARLAGLPDRLAHRIEGDDLTVDARALASVYAASGGELVAGTGFDGGARGGYSPPRSANEIADAAIRQTFDVSRSSWPIR